MTLSTRSSPSIESWAPGVSWARWSFLAAAFQRMSSTSELLPEPLTPGDRRDQADRERGIHILEVVVPGAPDDDGRAVAGPAVGGDRDRGRPLRYLPVSESFDFLTLAGGAGGGDLAAEVARAGAEVDEVVGRLDHLAVVLDQDQGVAQVAEPSEGVEQPGVVARVEADGRLVEDVEHAGQAAADLAGQADPLALAAGEGGRPPGQAQVVEPDVDEELEPLADLADEVAGDVLLVAVEVRAP